MMMLLDCHVPVVKKKKSVMQPLRMDVIFSCTSSVKF